MKAPDFWRHDGLAAKLLSPLSALYTWGVDRRLAEAEGYRAAMPVICVGNIIAGGTGKTPVASALADRLRGRGLAVHLLTRGYGGSEAGPLLVNPRIHDAAQIGDEALLLAGHGPTWVAHWRPKGAAAAAEMGAQVLVMDDGFQNPTLVKDLSLVVVDGGYGFGNGRVMPAGPCREPVDKGLARAHAVVLIGEDRTNAARYLGNLPVLRARLIPGPEAAQLAGSRVIAFAGIGRPGKFFETLRNVGAKIVSKHGFADHHPYTRGEIEELVAEANDSGALLVTTAKDMVRIPPDLRRGIAVLTVTLGWDDPDMLDRLLDCVVRS